MSETAVVNASPVIYLARANYFHLLHLAAPEILVPSIVASELSARGHVDAAARAAGMYLSDQLLNAALAEIGE